MLKFSKLNILTTTLLSIIVIFFTISNFTDFDDEYLNKKINQPINSVIVGLNS